MIIHGYSVRSVLRRWAGRSALDPKEVLGAKLRFWHEARQSVTLAEASVPNGTNMHLWTASYATVTQDSSVKFGGNPTTKIVADATTNQHGLNVAVDGYSDRRHGNFKVFVKDGDAGYFVIQMYGDGNSIAVVRLSDGVVTSSLYPGTVKTTQLDNGWWEISIQSSTQYPKHVYVSMSFDGTYAAQTGAGKYLHVYGATVTQTRLSALSDQSGNGHHASQASPNLQPLVGPTGQSEILTCSYDNADDTMFVARGSQGWHGSGHSFYVLMSDLHFSLNYMYFMHAGSLVFAFNNTGHAAIYEHYAGGWQVFNGALAVGGPSLLEFHLPEGGGTGHAYQTTPTEIRDLGSITWPNASLNSDTWLMGTGWNTVPADLACMVFAHHNTSDEQVLMRDYMRHVANMIGVPIL